MTLGAKQNRRRGDALPLTALTALTAALIAACGGAPPAPAATQPAPDDCPDGARCTASAAAAVSAAPADEPSCEQFAEHVMALVIRKVEAELRERDPENFEQMRASLAAERPEQIAKLTEKCAELAVSVRECIVAAPTLEEVSRCRPEDERTDAVTAIAGRPAVLTDPSLATDTAPDVFTAKFETTKGAFTIEVTRQWAPIGADRFYNLVKMGFYDDAVFFRVVPGFMAQFGIPGDPEVGAAWLEANLSDEPVAGSNRRGVVSFARSGRPDSRSTQLFINYRDHPALDKQGFTPIGQVVAGLDVVDALEGKYGEQTSRHQGEIYQYGNAFLDEEFPGLDRIVRAEIAPWRADGSAFQYAPTAANLEAFMAELQAAVRAGDAARAAAFTRALLPTRDSLRAALRDDAPAVIARMLLAEVVTIPHADAAIAKEFNIDPERTVVRVHGATAAELVDANRSTGANAEFPEGAAALARAALRPDVRFYEVELLAPGKDRGRRYHMLYFDGAGWSLLGSAWRWLN